MLLTRILLFVLLVKTAEVFANTSALESASQENIISVHDQQWLSLLHYQKQTLSNSYKSLVKGSKFFLSSLGATDPKMELTETLSQMFSGSDQAQEKTQCRFLARRQYFIAKGFVPKNAHLFPCPEAQDWIERIGAEGLSLVYASGSMGNVGSVFGHLFLKVHSDRHVKNTENLNSGINFAARTEETTGALYALKGLFGEFPGTFGIAPMHQLMLEYTNLEGREIYEYQLNLNSDQTKFLLWHLLELQDSYFEYYFLNDNCASMILQLIEITKPGINLKSDSFYPAIPSEALKKIFRSGLVTNIKMTKSLKSQLREKSSLLDYSNRKVLKKKLSEKQLDLSLSTDEIETLQLASAVEAYKDRKSWKDYEYSLSLERAKRETIEDSTNHVSQVSSEALPHDMLDSASMNFGLTKNTLFFGVSLFSKNKLADRIYSNSEIKAFSINFETSKDLNYQRLKDYTLLKVDSENDPGWLDNATAWSLDLSGNSVTLKSDEKKLYHHIGIGYGSFLTLGKNIMIRGMLDFDSYYFPQGELTKSNFIDLNVRAELLTELSRKLNASISVSQNLLKDNLVENKQTFELHYQPGNDSNWMQTESQLVFEKRQFTEDKIQNNETISLLMEKHF